MFYPLLSLRDDSTIIDLLDDETFVPSRARKVAANRTVLMVEHNMTVIADLSDVITTRWVTTFVPTPLPIIGPPGTRAVVDATLAALAAAVVDGAGLDEGAP